MALNDRAYRVSSVKRQVFLGNLVIEEISLKNNAPIRKLNIGNTEEEVIRLDK